MMEETSGYDRIERFDAGIDERRSVANQPTGLTKTRALDDDISADQLALIVAARKARERFLPADLFADPAWDVLLDLYLAKLRQERRSISDACVASGVAASTALRWLSHLEQAGLVRRSPDKLDGRRTWIELTDSGSGALAGYFSAVRLNALTF